MRWEGEGTNFHTLRGVSEVIETVKGRTLLLSGQLLRKPSWKTSFFAAIKTSLERDLGAFKHHGVGCVKVGAQRGRSGKAAVR